MANRLLYSPKIWCYIKDTNETIHDVSPYVISGNVKRLVDQVSTATVVLRNPDKIFTSTASHGAAFHPMDPITIFMQRLAGHPVRVFTGYLDDSDWYQMFPGPITLNASCTLKKLLYAFFDPALPYMNSFLTHYGWTNRGDGSIVANQSYTAGVGAAATSGPPIKLFGNNQLNDGSISRLIHAVMTQIGGWDDTNIYVEPIPAAVPAHMATLMHEFQQEEKITQAAFTAFMNAFIGTTSHGSGGATSNNIGPGGSVGGGNLTAASGITVKHVPATSAQLAIVNDGLRAAKDVNAPERAAIALIAAMTQESSCTDLAYHSDPGSGESIGPLQVLRDQAIADGINPHDAYQSSRYFLTKGYWIHGGAISIANGNPGMAIGTIAQNVQGSAYPLAYEQWVPEATNTVRATGGAATATAGVGVSGNANLSSVAGTNIPASVLQAGATGNTPSAVSSDTKVYHNPFERVKSLTPERTDQGVDYHTGGAGDEIVAIGDGVCIGIIPDWYQGEPLMWYRLSNGDHAGQYVYYAEGIVPKVQPGDKFTGGAVIAVTNNQKNGLEFGFAQADGNVLTPAGGGDHNNTVGGLMFARFLRSIGCPVRDDPGPGPGASTSGGATGQGAITGGGGSTGTTGTTAGTGNMASTAAAAAFTTQIEFPSIQDMVSAQLLQGDKALMNDKPLLPFVQQLTQASLRSFQSLPNGDFFAFYPDYFGEMGHNKPYWYIDDIEILDGGIRLSDQNIATHVYAIGDSTWPVNDELTNELFSAGTVTIFNAFLSSILDRSTAGKQKVPASGASFLNLMNYDDAIQFIKRYGARPLKTDYPMVRSPIFEMLLAYQNFALAWSRQFITPFEFTFMPELYPGGKVGFPNHGLQMYIEGVTHSWDLTSGFTTSAILSAPSIMEGATAQTFPELPPNMVTAMVDPIRPSSSTADRKLPIPKEKIATGVHSTVDAIKNATHRLF